MDKKMMFVFALFLIVAIFSAVAMAEETEDLQNTTEHDMAEAEIMHTGLGAKVRLLQLEKSITKNYIYGEQVLNISEEKGYVLNTTDLKDIVDELRHLKEEVSSMIEKINETTPEAAVAEFVAAKERAINLTQEFRTIIRLQLAIEHRETIKKDIDNDDCSEIEDLNHKIKNVTKEFNKERVMDMLKALNITDETLLQRIESGNITVAELRKLITEDFKEIEKERKEDFLEDMKEEREEIQLIKHQALASKLNLEKEIMDKVKEILKDNNFTYQEKKAKLGVMAQEKIKERIEKKLQEKLRERQEETEDADEDKNETEEHNETIRETSGEDKTINRNLEHKDDKGEDRGDEE